MVRLFRPHPIAIALILQAGCDPEAQPPVRSHQVTADGTLWLLREETGTEMERWTVLDDADRPVGEVAVPEDARIGAIRGDTVWMVEADDLASPGS